MHNILLKSLGNQRHTLLIKNKEQKISWNENRDEQGNNRKMKYVLQKTIIFAKQET